MGLADTLLPEVDPTQVHDWPGALVAVALIGAVALSIWQNRRIEKRLGRTNHGSHSHGEAIDALRDVVEDLKGDVDTMRQDVGGMRSEMRTMRTDVGEVRAWSQAAAVEGRAELREHIADTRPVVDYVRRQMKED